MITKTLDNLTQLTQFYIRDILNSINTNDALINERISQYGNNTTTDTINPSSSPTQIVTTLSSHTSSAIRLSNLSNEPKSVSGKIIGLSIGLPIGIFCLGLLIFLIYFYFIKNSILISNPPVSATDGLKSSKSNWFNNLFNIDSYGNGDARNGNNRSGNAYYDLEKNTKENILWPSDNAIESRIQYNIGLKDKYNHVLTPEYAHTEPPFSRHDSADINTFLYSKPPNIYRIGSQLPSRNDLSNDQASTNDNEKQMIDDPSGKWEYNSPLSKWFLRSSTYFKERNITSPSLTDLASKLTPTVQLKHLKILNRVKQNYVSTPIGYEDERSPILDKSKPQISHIIEGELNDSHGSLLLPSPSSSDHYEEAQKRKSFIYDSIGPQTLKGNGERPITVTLSSVPPDRKKTKTKKQHHDKIDALSYDKELPLTPSHLLNTAEQMKEEKEETFEIESGKIYKVIRPYSPRLTDEISISAGEYVRVIVTHNDGWCLVEKCTMDGTSKSLLYSLEDVSQGKVDNKEKKYLNDDRGIIPGECLGPRI